ncbi:MAG TPA: ABC transporter ATP-binding protein [Lactobacillus sp.]|nr:ABC transporter ATP-binding protein [Lactobacillus sp.]
MIILKTNHLTKRYGKHTVVADLNLTVQSGELVAFLGPNGAGKSTTIKMLTSLLPVSEGTVEINQTTDVQSIRQDIGIVFQESILDDTLTVKENLLLRARLYGKQAVANVVPVIDKVGATEFAGQTYGSLSGGQRRRVDIARALLNHPKLLFLDEPTTGLDIQTRSSIWAMLKQMQTDDALTIFLTTHYLEEAEQANDVYIIDYGQLIAHGTAHELKMKFANGVLELWSDDCTALMAQMPSDWVARMDENAKVVQASIPANGNVVDFLDRYRQSYTDFEFRKGSMDDVFLALTGREVR